MSRIPAAPTWDAPASVHEARSAYLDQSVVAYLLYGVGAVTAFLAVALSLSDAAAALHSSVLATGLLLAGLLGDRVDVRLGVRRAQLAAYLSLVVAGVLVVTTLAYPLTLAGAGLVGFGAGVLLAHLNRTLTRGGGTLARVRMSRAAFVAMLATLSVPIAIGVGEAGGLGWQLAFAIPAAFVVAAMWRWRARPVAPVPVSAVAGRLPRSYWLAWWLLVLGVSVEFSVVFWASTLVERQVGISLADATLVAASFYAGMAAMRVALSFHVVSGRDPIRMMRLGLVVALLGTLLAWWGGDVATAAIGIFLGGLGTGSLYPLGASVALAMVPGLQDRASARLILASGVAILVAPFVLGLAAELSGVSAAWLLVPALCLAGLGLSLPVDRARRDSTAP